jgi:hypothetical protein
MVWPDENKGVLKCYEAKKTPSGTWTANINIKDFKKGSGSVYTDSYISHAYAYTESGKTVPFRATSFNVESIPNPTIIVTETGIGKFRVTVKDPKSIGNSTIDKVVIPIWCAKNQEDLIWYDPIKVGNDWIVDVDTKNHQRNIGTYHIHVYMQDSREVQTCSVRWHEVVIPPMEVKTEFNSDKTKCTITASKIPDCFLKCPFVITDMATGEIKQYEVTKISENSYKVTIDVKPKRNYHLDVLAYMDDNVYFIYSSADFNTY